MVFRCEMILWPRWTALSLGATQGYARQFKLLLLGAILEIVQLPVILSITRHVCESYL